MKRVADAADGRRVRVELRPERLAVFAPLFIDFVAELESLCAKYSVEQLELIAESMLEAARRQQACAAKLSSQDAAAASGARTRRKG